MKIRSLAAALCAVLLLTACGSSDSSSRAADKISGTDSSVSSAAESKAESTSDTQSADENTEPETVSVPEQVSEPDNSEPETPPDESSEPEEKAPPTYEEKLASVDGSYKFTSADGEEATFAELLEKGTANVTDMGKGFALFYSGGGAGNMFFDLYFTNDGGATWEKGEPYSLKNGKLQFIRIEDGRILIFDRPVDTENNSPDVHEVRFYPEGRLVNDNNITDLWFSEFSIDGSFVYGIDAEYKGGYVMDVTLKALADESETGMTLFSGTVELDHDTLQPLDPKESTEGMSSSEAGNSDTESISEDSSEDGQSSEETDDTSAE
ncbi:MAG: hypothetical protein IKO27_03010 [Ruminococcus sp.]|nr:hypothetical protein [Ruminococcus sp.]